MTRSSKRKREYLKPTQSRGPSTDANNAPVIDPTENVLSLVAAAIQRQDDLRAAEARLHTSEIKHLKEIAILERSHGREIRQAESDRINAIRAVDVGAVNRAAEVASAQAQNLATQLITTAEAMRVQVAAAAQQAQTGLVAALEPIQKDVSELRQVQFQQQGERVARVDDRATQRDVRDIHTTERTQSNWQISAAISIGSLLLALLVFIAAQLALRGG